MSLSSRSSSDEYSDFSDNSSVDSAASESLGHKYELMEALTNALRIIASQLGINFDSVSVCDQWVVLINHLRHLQTRGSIKQKTLDTISKVLDEHVREYHLMLHMNDPPLRYKPSVRSLQGILRNVVNIEATCRLLSYELNRDIDSFI
jgi:hypothetical protein